MLDKLRKAMGLAIAVILTACSASAIKQSKDTPLTISPVKPVDAQALGGGALLSYDVYVDGEVLHALFALATETPKQPYMAYVRSADGGRTWSKPSEIGQLAAANIEFALGNDIQIAAAGETLLAIWQVTGEIPGMGPLQSVYSTDGGAHWQQGSNPTGSETDQSHADLIADSQGRFHLVWLDDRDENGYQGIRYARSSHAGQDWELAQTIDDSSCSCCWNRLLAGEDGQVNVLYRDMEVRDMALARSADAGQSWQRVSTVGEFGWKFDGCPHNGGALAWAGDTLHALAWTGAETKAGLYHLVSEDDGQNWSKPQAMRGEGLAFHSDLAAIGEQHLVAIWDARGADGSAVLISESFDNGRHWQAARRISSPGRSAQFPRLVATPETLLAMWVENKQWQAAILR